MGEASQPTIAVITPTLGRPTLRRAMDSLRTQLGPNDEWRVVGDGSQPAAANLIRQCCDPRLHYSEVTAPHSTYGNAQRNAAMRESNADLLVFLDDDDLLMPDALAAVRAHGRFRRPMMFRMDYRPGRTILWKERTLRVGNIAGAMFVVPRIEGRWCEWPETSEPQIGDVHFIHRTLSLWPEDSLLWCEEILCRCEKHGGGT